MMTRETNLLIRIAGAACVGGLLGLLVTTLLHDQPLGLFPELAITVIGILFGIIAMAYLGGVLARARSRFNSRPEPMWGTPGAHRPPLPPPPPNPQPAWQDAMPPTRPLPPPPVTEAPPQSAAVHIQNWWSHPSTIPDAGPAPVSATTERTRRPAPDVNAYGRTRRVVQCPRCAGFAVNLQQTQLGPDFTCARCQQRWSWRPGTSWPPVTAGLPPNTAASRDAT